MKMQSKYLEIINAQDKKDCYILRNKQQDVIIGFIERVRVGRFMHWCLVINDRVLGSGAWSDNKEMVYFTNGCLKEISAFITKLYSKK